MEGVVGITISVWEKHQLRDAQSEERGEEMGKECVWRGSVEEGEGVSNEGGMTRAYGMLRREKRFCNNLLRLTLLICFVEEEM